MIYTGPDLSPERLAEFERARDAVRALEEPLPLEPEYDIAGNGGPVTIQNVVTLIGACKCGGLDDEMVLFAYAETMWKADPAKYGEAANAICKAIKFKLFEEAP